MMAPSLITPIYPVMAGHRFEIIDAPILGIVAHSVQQLGVGIHNGNSVAYGIMPNKHCCRLMEPFVPKTLLKYGEHLRTLRARFRGKATTMGEFGPDDVVKEGGK